MSKEWIDVNDELPAKSGWVEVESFERSWYSKEQNKFKVSQHGCVYFHSVKKWRPVDNDKKLKK
jgi:hypothetical protein